MAEKNPGKYPPKNPRLYLDVSENIGFSPQIIHLTIGFSIINTIHFGGKLPNFWKHPYII